ncbi:MAG: CHAD domain-containing protein [Acidobacteriota bacterium]
MRTLARPGLVMRRRIAALDRQVGPAVEGEVEAVHQARVASRRLREMLPLLMPAAGEHVARSLRRDVRAVTEHLGPLRELDVALDTLVEIEAGAPDHAAGLAIVRSRLRAEREHLHARVARALADQDPLRLIKRLRAAAADLNRPGQANRCAIQAGDRLAIRVARFDEASRAVGAVFAPGPLHDVRIALKKFRYALEIASELGRFRLTGSIRRLKALQDVLGTLHDYQVLAGRIRDAEAATSASAQRRSLRALTEEIDQRVRRLHSLYLVQRETIVSVAAQSRRTAATLRAMGAEGT